MNVWEAPAGPLNYTRAARTASSIFGWVIHATEGYPAGDLQTLRFGSSRASAHALIVPSGDVFRIVPPECIAHHCMAFGGVAAVNVEVHCPTWLPPYNGRYSAINAATLGYELSGFVASGFTDSQYRSLAALMAQDAVRWQIAPTYPEDVGNAASILTHARLQNDRSDPGPLFDRQRFRNELAAALDALNAPIGASGADTEADTTATTEEEMERIAELEAALAAAEGIQHELDIQIAALREEIGARDSELGAVRAHELAPALAAVDQLSTELAAAQERAQQTPRIARTVRLEYDDGTQQEIAA